MITLCKKTQWRPECQSMGSQHARDSSQSMLGADCSSSSASRVEGAPFQDESRRGPPVASAIACLETFWWDPYSVC